MSTLLQIILEALWFFLPACVANMAPVLANHSRWLTQFNQPIDQGYYLGQRRVLGANKTWRGLAAGILFGLIIGYIQYLLHRYPAIQSISLVSYSSLLFSIGLGAWLGFGALLGDAVKSFAKRRIKINPGKSWMPFDQIDLILGALLLSWWIAPLQISHIVAALCVIFFLSLFVSFVGVQLKIKKTI